MQFWWLPYVIIMVLLVAILALPGCVTRYLELKGECVVQEWKLASFTVRSRMICDLPPPGMLEEQVRDREAMDVNPFPDLFERNPADSTDPNLLEKAMEYPQPEGEDHDDD